MLQLTGLSTLPTRKRMLRAFLTGDPAAEGIFYAAVTTTGIFCRPTCPARKPDPRNIEFFATASEAFHSGYRPCKRCRPMDVARHPPALVERLRDAVERNLAGRLTDKDLAAMGIEPSTARRQFKQYTGVTFHAYYRARRMGLALHDVRNGRDFLDIQLDRGFESASAFRDAFTKTFGVPPSKAKDRDCLLARRLETPLGTMLALANDQGLYLLDFVDRRGLDRKLLTLRTRLHYAIVPGNNEPLDTIATQLRRYFSGESLAFDVPLVPIGSPWEQRVWRHLLTIPPGRTKSYSQMAEELGHPDARRAVGRANGMNYLAIVIPCHRVIRADGSLCGYGGGLWRKQWLLEHERHSLFPSSR
ncbi:MAG: bifunctional transcriptional activator/DNA repair protein Ada [Nitrospirae bacterium]|nr:bifunctional transcriptional activator/DNA repair protein Ada [Nitrospirota bacterium]